MTPTIEEYYKLPLWDRWPAMKDHWMESIHELPMSECTVILAMRDLLDDIHREYGSTKDRTPINIQQYKIKNKKVFDIAEWNELIIQTYGRPYDFGEQEGGRDRGVFELTVPSTYDDDYENDKVSEEDGADEDPDERGVSFKAWLERDPTQKVSGRTRKFELEMWWHRQFYPSINTVAFDLYQKGILEPGDYLISINW